jgi:hypothetical protein
VSAAKPLYGKPALDAMTDQSFAAARDQRACAPPVVLQRSGEAVAILAEMFPGQEETAARVTMCIAQMLEGSGLAAFVIGPYIDVLALAAEQLAREAGEP